MDCIDGSHFFLYKNAERLSFELRLNVFISFEDFNLRNVLKNVLKHVKHNCQYWVSVHSLLSIRTNKTGGIKALCYLAATPLDLHNK